MPRPLLAVLIGLVLAAAPTRAQNPGAGARLGFGSADDPFEGPAATFARPGLTAAAYAAPTFLGSTWRGAVALEAEGHRERLSAGFGGTLHSGDGGLYDPEADALYDLVRLVRYVRLDPDASFPIYARVGPSETVTFGRGHLIRDYRSNTSWDERTVGAEFAVESPGVLFGAFTGDLRGGVVGARVEVTPTPGAASPLARSFRLGASAVHDLKIERARSPTGFEADAHAEVRRFFGLGLTPWVSYAQYLEYGRSVGAGLDLGSDEALGTVSFRLTAGLFVNGDGFSPGYVSPFYQVSNPEDRIVTAESFFERDTLAVAGLPLGDTEGGVDALTELELSAFRSVKLFYHFRRHYGDQRLSDFSLRLALRPRFVDGLGIALAIERQGLGSVFTLFDNLENQNTLVFDIDFPIGRFAHASIRSRYGYRLLDAATEAEALIDGEHSFLVQRRFEPFVGLRVRL